MTVEELLATASVIRDTPGPLLAYARVFARAVLDLLGGDAQRLRAEIVAWAKAWREVRCRWLNGCDGQRGDHDEECPITTNERDGIALLDALAIAEAKETP